MLLITGIIILTNLLLFAALVSLMLYYKTAFFSYKRRYISESRIDELMESDRKTAAEAAKLANIGNLSASYLDGDVISVLVYGYEPKKIDLNKPPLLRDMFSSGSANRIAYNSFEVQRQCIRQFNETGDKRLIKLFWHFYREWKSNLTYVFFDDYAWYDHCVAGRVVNIRYCLLALLSGGLLSRNEYAELMNFIIVNGNYIASDRQYDWITNHGLIVDSYLLKVAVTMPGIECREKWLKRSLERSSGRIDHYISDDGVPLEGSTTYWYLIYQLFNDIYETCTAAGIKLQDGFKSKLDACRNFLVSTNIHGKINRIGDSSGNYDIKPLGDKPPQSDGYYLYVCDTGLVYLNAVKDRRTRTQFILNCQDNKPYVHRHEDALSVGLYHDGVFWFNSPGSYTAGRSSAVRYVKSCKNQSVVYEAVAGYSHLCRIESVRHNGEGFVIETGIYDDKNGKLLTRIIKFVLDAEELIIEDYSDCGHNIISQFMLNPDTKFNQEDGFLICGDKKLKLISDRPFTVIDGKISYGRNQLQDTAILAADSPRHIFRICLASGIKNLYVSASSNYPYKKRQSFNGGFVSRLVRRLHKQRLKQILAMMTLETAAVVGLVMFVCRYIRG